MIGLGCSIDSVAEFNRRADKALNGIEFGCFNRSERVVAEFRRQLAACAVSEAMQQAIYNILHRYRRQVTDTLVRAYAAERAKGCDA